MVGSVLIQANLVVNPPVAYAQTKGQTLDDLFEAVATQVPAFGGMFLSSDQQTLQVYLTDTSPDKVSSAQRTIVDVFGAAVIPEGGIRALQGQYGFLQLREWYKAMVGSILSTPGVTATDINEATNRLVIGLEKSDVEVVVLGEIARLNIPRDVVVTVVTGEIVPLTNTLQDTFTPRQGGYQIVRLTNNVAGYGLTLGTLGFNAIRSNDAGFVTNSHVTQIFWDLDTNHGYPPADFYQASGYFPNQLVGTEFADPQPFPCPPPYPSGYKCRYSDSAFVKYNSGVTWDPGIIAQPTGITTLSPSTANLILTVDPSSKFTIVAPPSKPYLVGLQLSKVGRTTGWTTGPITYAYYPSTCADFVDTNHNVRLCQYVAGSLSSPDGLATFGDSGSPVFRISNSQCEYVELYGILWGGFLFFVPPSPWTGGSVARFFVFSPIGGVPFQQTGVQSPEDLGPLNYLAPSTSTTCAGCMTTSTVTHIVPYSPPWTNVELIQWLVAIATIAMAVSYIVLKRVRFKVRNKDT
jgi:hypothetical protein